MARLAVSWLVIRWSQCLHNKILGVYRLCTQEILLSLFNRVKIFWSLKIKLWSSITFLRHFVNLKNEERETLKKWYFVFFTIIQLKSPLLLHFLGTESGETIREFTTIESRAKQDMRILLIFTKFWMNFITLCDRLTLYILNINFNIVTSIEW